MGAEGPATSQDDILYVGLDLGTSQSSICTSTDLRRTVTSVVGWPKDLISYKFLQKQVVIGDECLEHRMAVDMIWPMEQVSSAIVPATKKRAPTVRTERPKPWSTWSPT